MASVPLGPGAPCRGVSFRSAAAGSIANLFCCTLRRVPRPIAIACIVSGTACGRLAFEATDGRVADAAIDTGGSDMNAIAGLVAWYPMDDDPTSGTLRDLSPNHLDGSCATDACPAVATGKLGTSFQFDGVHQRFAVTDDGRLQQTAGYTVTVWVMRAGSGTALSKPLATGPGASWELAVDDAGVWFYSTDADGEGAISGPPLPLDLWSHVAMSCEGGAKRLYVDGSEVAFTSKSLRFDSTPLQIGADQEDGVVIQYFRGRLDELRIYDRALSPAEIQQIYQLR